jgi:hypothetical protein
MNIISASRRTDIPALYTDWFLRRIEEGFVAYPNPFSGTIHTVSLAPEDVHSIVFWSKHYRPLLPHLEYLQRKGFRMFFHYTINGLPRCLEPSSPPWELSVRIFKELSHRTSSRHVAWRFDPIVITEELDSKWYIRQFTSIGSRLMGSTERCYISFVHLYGKTKRNLNRLGVRFREPSLEEKLDLSLELERIARGFGMELLACCQPDLVTKGIKMGRCVDGELLSELFPERTPILEHRPTRPGCGCTASRDIGMYDTCSLGCTYCYANQSRTLAHVRRERHDPSCQMLLPAP